MITPKDVIDYFELLNTSTLKMIAMLEEMERRHHGIESDLTEAIARNITGPLPITSDPKEAESVGDSAWHYSPEHLVRGGVETRDGGINDAK